MKLWICSAATLTPEIAVRLHWQQSPRIMVIRPSLKSTGAGDLRLCDDLGRLGEHHRDQLSLSGAL